MCLLRNFVYYVVFVDLYVDTVSYSVVVLQYLFYCSFNVSASHFHSPFVLFSEYGETHKYKNQKKKYKIHVQGSPKHHSTAFLLE